MNAPDFKENQKMKSFLSPGYAVVMLVIVFALATTSASAQWVNSAALTASDGQAGDEFGMVVAVDGNTMVIGAPGRNTGIGVAVAYVFTESNGSWTQAAELSASDARADEGFGASVAVRGNTIVVGASSAGVSGTLHGTAYVFVKPATGWTDMTETAKLTASDGVAGDHFGTSVAIDDATVAVSATSHQIGSNLDQGAIYIFAKPASGWTNMTQNAELTASDGAAEDFLGLSVALRGSTLVAGAPRFQFNTGEGAVYVFEKPAGGWVNGQQSAELTATDSTGDGLLGSVVAITADESTIFAGAPFRYNGGAFGAAYIYSKPAGGWDNATESSELLPPAPGYHFGNVAANGPGTILVVGAPGTGVPGASSAGAAYVYRKPSAGWPVNPTANARLTSPFPQKLGLFGTTAVRGTTIIVGANNETVNGSPGQGRVYVFDRK